MPRIARELRIIDVERLVKDAAKGKPVKDTAVGGCRGLTLQFRNGRGYYVLRHTFNGSRRVIGIGAVKPKKGANDVYSVY